MPAHILIVDDSDPNREMLMELLDSAGYKTSQAENGLVALAKARENQPDLILLDITMPEMNGYDVCRHLKEDSATSEIPVIFLTALTNADEERTGFELGAVDYIHKPMSMSLILARVRTHLALKEAREFLREKNKFLETSFSRYVSPRVIEQLKATPAAEFLKMERREVSVLFVDMRGFSRLGTKLPPEMIQESVNSFLENMVRCVEDEDGMVDKFLGDGVMAIFGAPLRQVDHTQHAIQCAMKMHELHNKWMAVMAPLNKPAEPIGIGIATGEVVVGNIGTHSRMSYTALGHSVNLASRLCGSAEGGEILTTTTLRDRIDTMRGAGTLPPVPRAYLFKSKGHLTFRNMDEPIEVLSVIPASSR